MDSTDNFQDNDFSSEILKKGYKALFNEMGISSSMFIHQLRKKIISELTKRPNQEPVFKAKKKTVNYYNYIYFQCMDIFRSFLSDKGVEILPDKRNNDSFRSLEDMLFPVSAVAEEVRNDMVRIYYSIITVPKIYFELEEKGNLKNLHDSIFINFIAEAESISSDLVIPVIFTDSEKIEPFQNNLLLEKNDYQILKKMLLIVNCKRGYDMNEFFMSGN